MSKKDAHTLGEPLVSIAARFPASDSRSRSVAANSRDAVAGIMTSEQIAEAQRLAREWKPK